MVASGICHSDVFVSCIPEGVAGVEYPKVLGHEGAGIVEEIGPGVTTAEVGDPVLLSYTYCSNCDLCGISQHAYCLNWHGLNVVGDKTLQTAGGENLQGKFFGQSSFSGQSIVSEGSVVNVKGTVNNDELKFLAPLGCGLMTGSGAVINTAKARPFDIIVVTGIGAVGLGAIMAAKIAGVKEIIAVDRVGHRLEVAKELGATQILESKPDTNLTEELQKLAGGGRISFVFETTGVVSVIQGALKALGKRGKLIQIGVPAIDAELTIPLYQLLSQNQALECIYLGETTGQEWVPKMIQWWREGKFPIEKLVKFYPIKDAQEALHGMESGVAIKPVLVW
jgi:Zn-dependent alcohol dehydrogenase